jgi:hypothetical protein
MADTAAVVTRDRGTTARLRGRGALLTEVSYRRRAGTPWGFVTSDHRSPRISRSRTAGRSVGAPAEALTGRGGSAGLASHVPVDACPLEPSLEGRRTALAAGACGA